MFNRLRIAYLVLRCKFVAGYVMVDKQKVATFSNGKMDGMETMFASIALVQEAGRMKEGYIENLINEGQARLSGRFAETWNTYVKQAFKNPFADIRNIIKDKEGRKF